MTTAAHVTRPHPLFFACVVAATVAFAFIDADLIRGATAAPPRDFSTFHDAARAARSGGDLYASGENLNPPHLYLLLAPMGALTRSAAWRIWAAASVVSLGLSLALIYRAIRPRLTPWRVWVAIVAVIATPATSGVLTTGQLSWLLLLPLTMAWVAMRRGQWTVAGALLGALISVKPFLAILLPYFALTRRWRPLAAAIGTGVACAGAGLAWVGVPAYLDWLSTLRAVSWAFLPMNGSVLGVLARTLSGFPAGHEHYASAANAAWLISPLWLAASLAVAAVTYATVRHERSPRDLDRNLAILLVAALLISPLGWIYYLWMPAGPAIATTIDLWARPGLAKRLLIASLIALFCPFPVVTLFQQHGWATVTIGSVYFWGSLVLWLSLVTDARESSQDADTVPALVPAAQRA